MERSESMPRDVLAPYDDLERGLETVQDGDAVYVLGARCGSCGQRMLGYRYACSKCLSRDLEEHRFGPTGTLYSFTEIWVSPTSATPYILAYVDLDEGARVLALVDARMSELECDQEVRLVTVGDDWAVRPEGHEQ